MTSASASPRASRASGTPARSSAAKAIDRWRLAHVKSPHLRRIAAEDFLAVGGGQKRQVRADKCELLLERRPAGFGARRAGEARPPQQPIGAERIVHLFHQRERVLVRILLRRRDDAQLGYLDE